MAEHVCGPWSECDASCMEKSYPRYCEAASLRHVRAEFYVRGLRAI